MANSLTQDFLLIRKSLKENEVSLEVARALGHAALLQHLGGGDPYASLSPNKILDSILPETKGVSNG